MADKQDPRARAHAQQKKSLFIGRVIVVEELDRKLVIEDGLGLLEGNPMPSDVRGCLGRVPVKPDHTYIVCTTSRLSRSCRISTGGGLPRAIKFRGRAGTAGNRMRFAKILQSCGSRLQSVDL